MQVKSQRGGVFGSGDRTRQDKNGEREGERCFGLANTKVCQGCSEVLEIDELLLLIHSEFFIHS